MDTIAAEAGRSILDVAAARWADAEHDVDCDTREWPTAVGCVEAAGQRWYVYLIPRARRLTVTSAGVRYAIEVREGRGVVTAATDRPGGTDCEQIGAIYADGRYETTHAYAQSPLASDRGVARSHETADAITAGREAEMALVVSLVRGVTSLGMA